MKPITTKYPHPQSVRLTNTRYAYAHQQSAKITKMLFLLLATAVVLSILLNVQQPIVNFIRSNFNSNNSNTEMPKETRLIAAFPVVIDSAGKNKMKFGELKIGNKSVSTTEKNLEKAVLKASQAFLNENDTRNLDVLNELSQVTEMHEFHFKKSSFQIKNEGKDELDRSMQKYIETPESYSQIIVLGFTDDRGTKMANVKLGMKRAESLKALLVQKGIPAEKITIASFGSELPIGSNESDSGRIRNRRVELNVLGTGTGAGTDVVIGS